MKFFLALLAVAGLAVLCPPIQAQTPDFMTGQAARLVIGQNNFTAGNYGATNTLLGSPGGIALVNGTLWVVDSNRLGASPNNNRILRFSDVSTYPTVTQDPTIVGSTCGVCRGSSSLVLGQPDFISASPSLTSTGMRSPTAVATDGKVLAVSDTDNNRVLIWLSLPRANGQPADVVIGQPDFTHNATSVPPTATSLRGPEGLWIANGKLYVADTQDNRILIYNKIPTTNNAAADVVVGQPNFTSFVQPDLTQNNATPAANNMQTPVSVTTDGTRMYVADLGQSRILIFNTIPTSNGASADVAIGQPDLVSAIDNNSYTVTNTTLDADNYPEGVSPVLCQSNGTDAAGTATFPVRCAATISFPRMALSDGHRLFVADGGNDRVLVFNTIPTASGARADYILGEPDEFSDNTGQNPDGTDAFQTPTSLAWDGSNLYVSDTYNRRVVVYSPALPNIPLAAIRNAASLEIYAIGSVAIGGTITAKDTVSIVVNGTTYTYTVTATDTLQTITDNLVTQINKAQDANVIASADDANTTVVLTARTGGVAGGNITLTVSTSANATETATTGGATLSIYLQNPTSIAPGTLIQLGGQNLCDNTAAGDFSKPYLPFALAGCQLLVDGVNAPLLYVSPTQINAQMPYEFSDRTSVSAYVRSTHADGSVSVTDPIPVTIVPENPGIFAYGGNDPRPGILYHGSSSATAMVSVDGSIEANDVGTITIGSATYTYTVKASDTLDTVRDAFISQINSGPDPNVTAAASDQYDRIILTALTPGPAGENIPITVAVTPSSTATLSLTALNAATCCDNRQGAAVTPDNPAAPSEFVYLFATGLGPTNPSDVDTGRVFPGGPLHAPVTPVDTILTGNLAATPVNVSLVPGLAGVYYVEFQLNAQLAADPVTQLHIAQQLFVSNVVTFPVGAPTAPAASSSPSSVPAVRTRRRGAPSR